MGCPLPIRADFWRTILRYCKCLRQILTPLWPSLPGTTALLLDGCIDITPELALRFSRYFGGGAELWLSLQAGYDVKVYARKHGADIVAQIAPMPGEGGNSYFVWGE